LNKSLIKLANDIVNKYGIHEINLDSKIRVDDKLYCITTINQTFGYDNSVEIRGIKEIHG